MYGLKGKSQVQEQAEPERGARRVAVRHRARRILGRGLLVVGAAAATTAAAWAFTSATAAAAPLHHDHPVMNAGTSAVANTKNAHTAQIRSTMDGAGKAMAGTISRPLVKTAHHAAVDTANTIRNTAAAAKSQQHSELPQASGNRGSAADPAHAASTGIQTTATHLGDGLNTSAHAIGRTVVTIATHIPGVTQTADGLGKIGKAFPKPPPLPMPAFPGVGHPAVPLPMLTPHWGPPTVVAVPAPPAAALPAVPVAGQPQQVLPQPPHRAVTGHPGSHRHRHLPAGGLPGVPAPHHQPCPASVPGTVGGTGLGGNALGTMVSDTPTAAFLPLPGDRTVAVATDDGLSSSPGKQPGTSPD